MKYVFLVYQEEPAVAGGDACRCRAMTGDARDTRGHLRQTGYLLSATEVQPWWPATTVRARLGGVAISDMSGASAPERLVEICLIEARDLNEAIRLAGRMPEARLGRIEVWALQEHDEQQSGNQ